MYLFYKCFPLTVQWVTEPGVHDSFICYYSENITKFYFPLQPQPARSGRRDLVTDTSEIYLSSESREAANCRLIEREKYNGNTFLSITAGLIRHRTHSGGSTTLYLDKEPKFVLEPGSFNPSLQTGDLR